MKAFKILLIFIISLCIGCKNTSTSKSIEINEKMLLNNLRAISHDSVEGRLFGSKGNKKAQQFIASKFDSIGVSPIIPNNYIQEFQYTFKGKERLEFYPVNSKTETLDKIPDTTIIGGNVIAKVKGKIENSIVITGHLDHLGIYKNEIYNGADDNASGAAALITIANYFKDKSPNHTLIFAAVDAEEQGSFGADYLIETFPNGLEKIVLNVNLDMIANNNASGLFVSGTYHYPFLKKPLKQLNSEMKLNFGHDDPTQKNIEDWTYISDHTPFHERNIPYVYFGVESHKDYHKPSDKYQSINPEFYTEAVKLIIESIEKYDSFLYQKNSN